MPEKYELSNNKIKIAQDTVINKEYRKSGHKYYFTTESKPTHSPNLKIVNRFNRPRINNFQNFTTDKRSCYCAYELS